LEEERLYLRSATLGVQEAIVIRLQRRRGTVSGTGFSYRAHDDVLVGPSGKPDGEVALATDVDFFLNLSRRR